MTEKTFTCLRCGHCCMAVGTTFWRNGDFTRWPELQRLADTTDSQDDARPCQFLYISCGVASCMIEVEYGRKAKPDVCREYGENNQCHQQLQNFKGQGLCLQVIG